MTATHYDVIVLGGGATGEHAAAAVGLADAEYTVTVPVAGSAKLATYARAYADSNGFLTLISDGDRLIGAYALGHHAGEWLQHATLAIRARVPISVLSDTIQPFPSFSERRRTSGRVSRTQHRDRSLTCAQSDASPHWVAPSSA